MVESLFQTRSSCLSKHDRLNHNGTLHPHVSGPHYPTMGGPLRALIDILPRQLEIDHRFPQVRWRQDEESHDTNMSETDIRSRFILLNRSHNLLKSRYCERCANTGRRGQFPGIEYWHEGDSNWDSSIDSHDEKGCEGCFWYDPYEWREELNNLVKQAQKG